MKKRLSLSAVALFAAACGSDHRPPQSFAGLTRVSGQSPFPAGCVNPAQRGTNYRSAEVEPFVAVDPTNAKHLVGVWQQDRWSNGGSNGLGSAVSFDGGVTWTAGFAAFTTCSGGTVAKRTNFERASDPWVTFAPDGTPHQIGFSFDGTSARSAMLAVRSGDGGRTWTDPIFLAEDTDPDVGLDKESITADPGDANLVYAVWDRLTGLTTPNSATQTGPAWFTRTTDGGASWEAARIIHDPGQNAQTISNQIVVHPNGALINLLTILTGISQQSATASLVAVLRSTDKGLHWSSPVSVSPQQSLGVLDPKNRVAVRTGDVVPAIAVDKAGGALYVAWEDSAVNGGARDGIALSRSLDGGLTWSAPVRVNGEPKAQAFTPAIAVASNGNVGVTYYDLRDDVATDGSQLLATAWLAISSDQGATWQESAASGPFDIRTAAQTEQGYFIGDYQGLAAAGASFLPFFVLTNDGNTSNRSDVFARPPSAPLVASAFAGSAFTVPRMPRSGPRRAY